MLSCCFGQQAGSCVIANEKTIFKTFYSACLCIFMFILLSFHLCWHLLHLLLYKTLNSFQPIYVKINIYELVLFGPSAFQERKADWPSHTALFASFCWQVGGWIPCCCIQIIQGDIIEDSRARSFCILCKIIVCYPGLTERRWLS